MLWGTFGFIEVLWGHRGTFGLTEVLWVPLWVNQGVPGAPLD